VDVLAVGMVGVGGDVHPHLKKTRAGQVVGSTGETHFDDIGVVVDNRC